jgi:hypothetical protein
VEHVDFFGRHFEGAQLAPDLRESQFVQQSEAQQFFIDDFLVID